MIQVRGFEAEVLGVRRGRERDVHWGRGVCGRGEVGEELEDAWEELGLGEGLLLEGGLLGLEFGYGDGELGPCVENFDGLVWGCQPWELGLELAHGFWGGLHDLPQGLDGPAVAP